MAVVTTAKEPADKPFPSDERLVRECLTGSEEAWSTLIDKYKNLIYSVPVKCGLYAQAEDIFQAVCLDLLRELPQIRQPRALPKWLIQTSLHKCRQYHGQQSRQVSLDESNPARPAQERVAGDEPEMLLAQLQNEQILREAIDSLPARCRCLVAMLFFDSPPRPYRQIAEELGIAVGSIGFIRGRCLSRLRRQIEKRGFR